MQLAGPVQIQVSGVTMLAGYSELKSVAPNDTVAAAVQASKPYAAKCNAVVQQLQVIALAVLAYQCQRAVTLAKDTP
jgi:hypothetical protein